VYRATVTSLRLPPSTSRRRPTTEPTPSPSVLSLLLSQSIPHPATPTSSRMDGSRPTARQEWEASLVVRPLSQPHLGSVLKFKSRLGYLQLYSIPLCSFDSAIHLVRRRNVHRSQGYLRSQTRSGRNCTSLPLFSSFSAHTPRRTSTTPLGRTQESSLLREQAWEELSSLRNRTSRLVKSSPLMMKRRRTGEGCSRVSTRSETLSYPIRSSYPTKLYHVHASPFTARGVVLLLPSPHQRDANSHRPTRPPLLLLHGQV
jgi:hypothetical protein